MHDMKKLAALVKELEEQLVVCMRCGMCQAVCPVYTETGREADVARGKLALLDGLIQQIFKEPGGVHERLMRCLLCGSCAANCPSGVKVLDIFLKARAILVGYTGLHPANKIIFRGMLSHPRVFNSLVRAAGMFQGVFLKSADEFLGTSCGRFSFPLAHRHLKAFAPASFNTTIGRLNINGGSGLKAGFFVGCLIDKIYPNIGHAVLSSLKANGVGVFVPDEQGCCGIPALSSGDLLAFGKMVRYNLDLFSAGDFDFLVTACATCTSTIKKLWPMFAGDLSEAEKTRINELAEKTMDISQFLVEKTGLVTAASDGKNFDREKALISYHDPCHLKKSLGIEAQPRMLLGANSGYVLKEMSEADRCCGCGGSFNLKYYEISASIGRRKRDSILQSGCSTVATSCPACMLQISDMLSQAGEHIRVKHAVEIYADSLERDLDVDTH
ncbi:glycolate dehydrogenase, glycolate, D-lactate, or L-lactate dehydrogenase, iron-sulfur subunit [Syntrophobacter sp. SbD1]|nr:glycolate dehydrogenase, glycolate, D-lactate, or L-lactate dehydrogenase, iron-sulfur subunit [Syntrophobacter sp. SbD1]